MRLEETIDDYCFDVKFHSYYNDKRHFETCIKTLKKAYLLGDRFKKGQRVKVDTLQRHGLNLRACLTLKIVKRQKSLSASRYYWDFEAKTMVDLLNSINQLPVEIYAAQEWLRANQVLPLINEATGLFPSKNYAKKHLTRYFNEHEIIRLSHWNYILKSAVLEKLNGN